MENQKLGMGWLPDYPDLRDYTVEHTELSDLDVTSLGSSADLRQWCSTVDNQGQIRSSTANAVAGVLEYFENKTFGKYHDISRLFLYKTARKLAKLSGDSGAFLRDTIKALVLFGVPPEEYWPYTDADPDFDMEPVPFCYSFGENYKAFKYFRHDPANTTKEDILASVKKALGSGRPSMFGFAVYGSITQAAESGKIPFPCKGERCVGGHAITAVGYDDNMVIENTACEEKTEGALLIRNSWGESWGDKGYGWLPYKYILEEQAMDFWSIVKMTWIDTGNFTIEELPGLSRYPTPPSRGRKDKNSNKAKGI